MPNDTDDIDMFVGIISAVLEELGYNFDIVGQNAHDFYIALHIHSGNIPITENFKIIHKGKGIINFDRGRFPDINLADPNSLEVLKTLLLVAPTILSENKKSEVTLRSIANTIWSAQLRVSIPENEIPHVNYSILKEICKDIFGNISWPDKR